MRNTESWFMLCFCCAGPRFRLRSSSADRSGPCLAATSRGGRVNVAFAKTRGPCAGAGRNLARVRGADCDVVQDEALRGCDAYKRSVAMCRTKPCAAAVIFIG